MNTFENIMEYFLFLANAQFSIIFTNTWHFKGVERRYCGVKGKAKFKRMLVSLENITLIHCRPIHYNVTESHLVMHNTTRTKHRISTDNVRSIERCINNNRMKCCSSCANPWSFVRGGGPTLTTIFFKWWGNGGIAGHHRPASEKPFKLRFAGGPMMAQHWILAW